MSAVPPQPVGSPQDDAQDAPDQPQDAAPGPLPDQIHDVVCSARGCRERATWGLLWNNPKLHTPERRKVWLACDGHREHLELFLGARSFLRDVVPVSELVVADQR